MCEENLEWYKYERDLEKELNVEAKKWYNFFFNKNISLYHYTSQNGLAGILSSNSIWFTESTNLNDRDEGKYLYNLLKDFLSSYSIDKEFEIFKNEIRETIIYIDRKYIFDYHKGDNEYKSINTFPHYFICSFCKDDDALAMWNYYSKSNSKTGFNIKFSLNNLRDSIGKSLYDELKISGEFRVYKVLYNIKQQKKLLKNAIDYFYKKWKETNYKQVVLSVFAHYLYVIKFALKHPAFETEKEIRMIVKMLNMNGDENAHINSDNVLVRTTENGFIPYISVPFKKSDIKHIKASPLMDNYESVKYVLQKYCYDGIEVDKSDIPLRF